MPHNATDTDIAIVQVTGFYYTINTHDPATATRSYAATVSKVLNISQHYHLFTYQAYYLPNKDRSNLTVLAEALVTKVVTTVDAHGILTATGVEFEYGEKKHIVYVREEAIISAG